GRSRRSQIAWTSGIPWRAMTEPLRVHLRVPGTAPMPALMRLLRSIEAAGFDGAGILDSQMLSRDTFVVLGQAAANTSRLTLFPAVTNPFTRHASVLAGAVPTLGRMAAGPVKRGHRTRQPPARPARR